MEKPSAPVAQAPEDKVMMERVLADPEAQRRAKQERQDKELGSPDTAQYDRLIAELERRKQSLEPKQGYEGLMEYLSQVSANSQPGRGSFASGAAGARAVDKLNRERQLEQFDLSKQAIEVSQKKLDTVRSYAEKRFNIGETEFDKVYKEQFEAAKEVAKNKGEAQKLAQENTLKLLEMENQRRMAANRDATSMATSGIQSESRFIKDWMSKPENKGKSYSDAYAAFKMAGTPSAGNRGVMTRDQASDNVEKSLENIQTARATIADAKAALAAAGISNPTMAQIKEHLIQEQIKGVSLTGAAQSIGAPPPGAVRLKTSGG
jgi:hypothetical protein